MKDKSFKEGDRVYHRNLQRYGTFEQYDSFDDTACFVLFDTDDDYEDSRCVSLNWLDKIDERNDTYMKKIKVYVSTNKFGSECTRIVELDEDTDEDQIEEIINEIASEMINIWHEEIE